MHQKLVYENDVSLLMYVIILVNTCPQAIKVYRFAEALKAFTFFVCRKDVESDQ